MLVNLHNIFIVDKDITFVISWKCIAYVFLK